jgi:hypothetical protein
VNWTTCTCMHHWLAHYYLMVMFKGNSGMHATPLLSYSMAGWRHLLDTCISGIVLALVVVLAVQGTQW